MGNQDDGQPVLTLPISKVSRFEKHSTACREKTNLILFSSLLLCFTSLSVCLLIVKTLITIPSFEEVKSSANVVICSLHFIE